MSYKKPKSKLAVTLLAAVLFFNNCSYLPEVYIDEQHQSIEGKYSELKEPQEELPDDCVHMPKPVEESRLVISAVGDIMVHMPQIKAAEQSDGSYDFKDVFQEVRHYIERADIAIGNLETTISSPEKGYSGYPRFRAPEQLLEALKFAGFDVLITANNHCLDGLEFGVEYTLNKMDEYGMLYAGTARNIEERCSHLIIEKNNIRLGILAYTYGTNGMEALIPRENLEYMVNYYNIYNKVSDDIKSIKAAEVDLVVLYMHWGYEYHRMPNDEQRNLAEMLSKAGADIIFGSHPHVIQPMELKKVNMEDGTEKNVLVVYSLGNFISNQKHRYTDSGVVVNVEIVRNYDNNISIDKISYVPTWVYKYYHKGKLQYRVLPVREYIDSEELKGESAQRIKSVWQETTGMLGTEVFQVED